MKYQISDSNARGVLVDNFPVYVDVGGTLEVSFSLPRESHFVAIFKATGEVEQKAVIKDGVCKLPAKLLLNQKTRYIDVSVAELNGSIIEKAWACDPLRVSSFFSASRSQLHISSGVSDQDYLKRVLDLENENVSLNKKLEATNSKVVEQQQQISTLTECIKKIVEKHNELVKQFESYKEEM